MQTIKENLYIQLQLFPETAEQKHSREIAELRHSGDKLRKSLHAKNGQLAKAYLELKNEFDQLKQSICRSQTIEQQQMRFLWEGCWLIPIN